MQFESKDSQLAKFLLAEGWSRSLFCEDLQLTGPFMLQKVISFKSPLIEMLISSKNTFTEAFRIMLDQICGHFAPAWLIYKMNHLTHLFNDRNLFSLPPLLTTYSSFWPLNFCAALGILPIPVLHTLNWCTGETKRTKLFSNEQLIFLNKDCVHNMSSLYLR